MPAEEKRRREGSRPARAQRLAAWKLPPLALALGACVLLLLALAALELGTPPRVQGHALIPIAPTNAPTPTDTATSTPTATPTPGTISLVSPSYGSGPVGAHVTVSGAGFSGSSVALKAASHPDCSSAQANLASASLAGGSFTQTFVWPSSLPNGTYYICANGTTSGPSYQQLATSAPAISLSAPSAAQESQLVISGSNFVGLSAGSSIQLEAQQGSAQANLPSGVVDANGQFTVPWSVDVSFTGTVVISAQSPPEGTAPPVLQASASVNVTPPSTATPSATASASPTSSGAIGGTTSTKNSGGGGAGLVLLIVLLIVAVLVGGGAAAFVLMRRNGNGAGGSGPQAPYPPGSGGYPGYPGYSPSPYGASSPGWDAPTVGMGGMGRSGQYPGGAGGMGTGTGGYGAAGGYGGYGGDGVGAVSQWDESAEEYGDEPSAGWQPRPMTGYGDFNLPPESRQGGGEGGGYAPTDPWGDASGYGSSGGGAGGGYGNYGSQDDAGWRNQAGDPGTTRPGGPGGGTQQRYPRQPQPQQDQGQGQSQGYGRGQEYGQGYGAGWPDEAPGGGGRPPEDWRQ
ncbi:MAG TPA: hypothetical protein VF116_10810 [Ktedonobacterales bacterium]